MQTRRACRILGAATASLLACAALAAAGTDPASHAPLRVSAAVTRHASIRVAPPASITLSDADVAAGFIDIATPVEVTVQSNVPQGYALLLQRQGAQVLEALVLGLDGGFLVGSGSVATRPATGHGLWRDSIQLRFRFQLAPDATPGKHPWPLAISLMAQ